MKPPISAREFATLRALTRPRTAAQLTFVTPAAGSVCATLLKRGFVTREHDAHVPGNPFRYSLSKLGAALLALLSDV